MAPRALCCPDPVPHLMSVRFRDLIIRNQIFGFVSSASCSFIYWRLGMRQ